MPEILEIMRGEFIATEFMNPVAMTDWGSFIANNAGTELQCDNVAVQWWWVFRTSTGRCQFAPRDNVIIHSCWLGMPYHYSLSRPGAVLNFAYSDNTLIVALPQIATPTGDVEIPVAGAEVAMGVFVPWMSPAGAYMALGASLTDCWVSQIGAAAVLNGLQFWPQPCIKVIHSLPLM